MPRATCLLGRRTRIKRRAPLIDCYNGESYSPQVKSETCPCTRYDYECSFGFDKALGFVGGPPPCVRMSKSNTPVQQCRNGTVAVSQGYRKISGDTCSDGDEVIYEPMSYPCDINKLGEFIIISNPLKIYDVTSGKILNSQLGGDLYDAEYDINGGCLYVVTGSALERQCYRRLEDTGSRVHATINGRLDRTSVFTLAFDWTSNHLYWADSTGRVSVAHADLTWRRTLYNITAAWDNLRLDPAAGYMYFTNRSGISRAPMDGKITDKVKMQQLVSVNASRASSLDLDRARRGYSVSFDLDIDRHMLYWASDEKWEISVLNLTDFTSYKFKTRHAPSSLVVYKNLLLYQSFESEALHSLDKYSGRSERTVLTSLRSVGHIKLRAILRDRQQGRSGCSTENGGCDFLCAPAPSSRPSNKTCLCPDTLPTEVTAGGLESCKCPRNSVLNRTAEQCQFTGNKSCPAGFASCLDGTCIPQLFWCDGESDCANGIDENSESCFEKHETCMTWQTQCASGGCIPSTWRCDHAFDCDDHSDEFNCTEVTCTSDHFRCDDGQCLMRQLRCDGDRDCYDGSDEKNCSQHTTSPGPDECDGYRCQYSSWCISPAALCNGVVDCPYSDDELNCSTSNNCSGSDFSCGAGVCIGRERVCDGQIDCASAVDEYNCSSTDTTPSTPSTSCKVWELPCSQAPGLCYSFFAMCDGVNDCPDGEDELYCVTPRPVSSTTTAEPGCVGKFRCWMSPTRPCIHERWVCDGAADCASGEDEFNCTYVTPSSCPERWFHCMTSEGCVAPAGVCDGAVDCADASDEQGCQTSSNPPNTSPNPKPKQDVFCDAGLVLCLNQLECISSRAVCDGVHQCTDGSDESAMRCQGDSPAVQKLWMSSVTTTAARVVWNTPGATGSWQYIPHIREVGSQSRNLSAVNSTSADISGLVPYTRYTVSVYTRETSSRSVYTPAVYLQFVTSQTAPTAPRQLEVTGCSHVSCVVKLSWRPPSRMNGRLKYYLVYYSSPMTTERSVQVKPADTSDRMVHNELLLHHSTNYTFSVSAVTVAESKRSSLVSLDLSKDVIQQSPNILFLSAKDHGAVVKWKFDGPSNNISYNVRILYQGEVVIDNSTKYESFIVTGLESGSEYELLLAAVNRYSRGPSISRFFTTTGVAVSAVQISSIDRIDVASVRVKWSTANNQSSDKSQYKLYYGIWSEGSAPFPAQSWSRRAAHSISVTDTSVELHELALCSRYWIGVQQTSPSLSAVSQLRLLLTSMNETAPPVLTDVTSEGTTLRVLLDSSCQLSSAVYQMEYVLRAERFDFSSSPPFGLHQIRSVVDTQTRSFPPSTQHHVTLELHDALPGAVYRLSVRTNSRASVWSSSKLTRVEALPSPEDLHYTVAANHQDITLLWSPPPHPHQNLPLVVWMSRGSSCRDLHVVQHVEEGRTNTSLHQLAADTPYCVAVSIDKSTSRPYYGALTDYILVDAGRSKADEVTISKSHVVAIVVPVAALVLVLVVVLAVYVIRHRRLQRSFLMFANSRYNVSFFTDDDDDGTDIQGIADDEPLVLA